ncbi:MAG: ABC transporter ATP-binding protein/permease [Defluviitaleaceae bacterium]|nr:ABC transporter ATP-binding protein/permease [Defluviitaleaceae bacterium]
MQKSKKEKPSFSTWQNTVYVLKSNWAQDKRVVLAVPAEIILAVAIATVWVFLPATVVGLIIEEASVETLALTVLAFTVGLMVLQGMQSYLLSTVWIRRRMLWVKTGFEVRDKVVTTDFSNIEEQAFSDARQKAQKGMYVTDSFVSTVSRLGTNVLSFIVFLFLLATANPLVIALTAATAVLGVAVRNWANRWRFKHDDVDASFAKRISNINHLGHSYYLGKEVRLFNMASWIREVFATNIAGSYEFSRQAESRQWLADAAGAGGNFILDSIVYVYLIWQVLAGNIAVDTFVLLLASVHSFSDRITGILGEMSELGNISLRYCRVREFLAYPERFKREDGENIPKADSYALSFENVGLRYVGTEENTLENINLHIEAGENLAVVGLNGAGKTTLVKLLCGFYDPTEGAVRLNGKDIRDFNRKSYYGLFTAVFQEFNILPNTIAENVAQEAGDRVDIGRVNKCLELAELTEKIEACPDGIHSLLLKDVNLNAVELSGGETQKLMLARALYKDAPILILDEPTAALDPIAESRLYERYNELSRGRTSVYISHRLASTRFCDRIILIDGKGIAETGTHDELIALGGKYAELFEIQSKYYKGDTNGTQSDA